MRTRQQTAEALEIEKLRLLVERLKRKVEELTGERGNNPAVRQNELKRLTTVP